MIEQKNCLLSDVTAESSDEEAIAVADKGVVVLSAGPTWQPEPSRDLTELAAALSRLVQYWRVAVTVASYVQNFTFDNFKKVFLT